MVTEDHYTTVWPLGPRKSKGSFDDIFSTDKYKSLQEAYDANDYATINFVANEDSTLYFEVYNVKNPEDKHYQMLSRQHFPAGIDVADDAMAINMALKLI